MSWRGQNATSFDLQTAMDTMWIFSCGVEICTMQLGFAMLEALPPRMNITQKERLCMVEFSIALVLKVTSCSSKDAFESD
eukprot:5593544-Amphidinium_carterae.1